MENILTDSPQDFKVDKWYAEHKGFYHICPQCGRGFFGRWNQIYCPGGQCKGVFNRSKNKYVNLLGIQVLKQMKKNRMILVRVRKQLKVFGMPDKEKLIKYGFDFQAASEHRLTNSGIVLEVYLDFGLWLDPQTETAFIFKFPIGDPRYQKFDGSWSSYFSIIQ